MRFWILAFAMMVVRVSAGDYDFSFNGKNISPHVSRISGDPGGAMNEGDVVWVREFPVVLAGPGTYAFRVDEARENVLLGKLPGEAAEHPIAVVVDGHWEGKKKQLEDPLEGMSAEAKTGLRGVVLNERPKDAAKSFDSIDWSRTFLSVTQTFCASDEKTLGVLPEGLRYFSLNLTTTPSLTDFSELAKAKTLVWLGLDSGVKLDARQLAGMSELRGLDLSYVTVENIKELASLSKLRSLSLRRVDGLVSLDFVASLKDLRWLDIAGTAVADLSSLNGLKELMEIDANSSQVAQLPDAPVLPALKRFKLLSTPAAAAKVEAFRKALPGCRVDSSWLDSLLQTVENVDRLRVRTGGTCHRDPSVEKVLFEITDRAEIQRIVNSWTINDRDSGFSCMCCGEPSFEFYRGNELVASLGFHHGRSLRWPGGWPGDALLTEVASDAICETLAAHGVTGPKTEHEQEKKRETAQRRLWSAYLEIVPESVMDEWRKVAGEEGDFHAVAVKAWPDAADRTARLFSLYGVMPQRSWRMSAGLDETLREKLLPKVPVADALALLNRKDLPPGLMEGLTRWALFGDDGKAFRNGLQDDALKRIGTWALTHPNADNRKEALYGLAGLPKHSGNALLLDFLAGKLEPRAVVAADQEPGDSTTFLPHADAPDEDAGELAVCAWLLSGAKVKDAKPMIMARIKQAGGTDKKVLEKSLKRIDRKK